MPAADNLKGQTAHRWKIPSLYLVRGAHLVEDILPYYAEDSLSAMFHDLLAELEPGCKGDAPPGLSYEGAVSKAPPAHSYVGLLKEKSQAGKYIEASANKMPPISQTVAPVKSAAR